MFEVDGLECRSPINPSVGIDVAMAGTKRIKDVFPNHEIHNCTYTAHSGEFATTTFPGVVFSTKSGDGYFFMAFRKDGQLDLEHGFAFDCENYDGSPLERLLERNLAEYSDIAPANLLDELTRPPIS